MFYPTAGQEGSFGSVVSSSAVCLSTLTTLPVSVPPPSPPLSHNNKDNHFDDQHRSRWSIADMTLSTAEPNNATSKSKKNPTFRSTKGASKQRRDLINTEIKNLRDLLPLADSVKARLSYLHVMSLACVYTRKCNFFSQVMGSKADDKMKMQFDFTPVVNGFLVVVNSEGGLLYISENVTEYLGHSMVDLLTQGGNIFDVIDRRDQDSVRNQLKCYDHTDVYRSFFCRMNTSRPMRRQDNCSDNKVVHISGCYQMTAATSSWSPLPVFIGVCSPISSSICRASSIDNTLIDTMIFTSHHAMDMKLQEISPSVMYHVGYTAEDLYATSWYNLLYAEDDVIGRNHHHYLIQQVQQGHQCSCEFVVRMLTKNKSIINVFIHATSRPDMADTSPIVCENRVISDTEMQYYKAIQQDMVVDTMLSGNNYLFPSPLPLESSEMWPTVEADDVELNHYFPVSNEEEMSDNQSQFLKATSPQQPSPPSPKDSAFTALKDATMKLVRSRLQKRLNSDIQSCMEPPRKTCCFDQSYDDNKYDVKFHAYSLPAMNMIGQDSTTTAYSPSSTTDVTMVTTQSKSEHISRVSTWAESPPTLPATPMTPLSQREGFGSLDVLCPYRLPNVPDNMINVKQEICIPESILTPDPSPNLDRKTKTTSRFTFNIQEEKTLSEDDLNTLRELASNLLVQTNDTDMKDIEKKTTNTNTADTEIRHALIEMDHCVPSVEGTNESSPYADNSFYAMSPNHTIPPTAQDGTQQCYKSAAGQHQLDSIEQLQFNLSHDQESSLSPASSIRSEPCFSDASSFIDELESIEMEITSSPSYVTPSHGDLGFCELDINTSINSFH